MSDRMPEETSLPADELGVEESLLAEMDPAPGPLGATSRQEPEGPPGMEPGLEDRAVEPPPEQPPAEWPVLSMAESAHEPETEDPNPGLTGETDDETTLSSLHPAVQPWRQGLVSGGIVLAAAVAGAGGVLLASGGDIPRLSQLPQSLLPTLAGITGGILLLALISGLLSGRATAKARRRYEAAEDTLAGIAALEPANPDSWLDERLARFDGVSRRISSLGESWQRLQERNRRAAGLEGELMRLQRALARGKPSDLADRFDSPAVGRVVDEVSRLIEELTGTQAQLDELSTRLEQTGPVLCTGLQDAVTWNNGTLDKLTVEVNRLQKVVQQVEALARAVQQARNQARGALELVPLLAEVEAELDNSAVANLGTTLHTTAESIRELVEQEGKLAFNIAMEVARLGAMGEPLLPLAQELESMTTDFKSVASQLEELGARQQEAVASLQQVRGRIEMMRQQAGQPDPAWTAWAAAGDRLNDLPPVLSQTASTLNGLVPAFNGQAERLRVLGSGCAELTGGEFVVSSPARSSESPPEAQPLPIDRFDPFAGGGGLAREKPARDGKARGEPARDGKAQSEPDPAAGDQSSLSGAGDKVYDLAELGAVPLVEPPPEAPGRADRVYDLAEFGAEVVT